LESNCETGFELEIQTRQIRRLTFGVVPASGARSWLRVCKGGVEDDENLNYYGKDHCPGQEQQCQETYDVEKANAQTPSMG